MKNILITGCGGAPAINFVRSLKDAKIKEMIIFGLDSNKYTLHRSECDYSFLCPEVTNSKYISFILNFIKKRKINFIHTQPENEVYIIGKHRNEIEKLGCKLFFPKQKTIEILRDKYQSYLKWKEKKIKTPENIIINNEKDLFHAFKIFQNNIWIREKIGAAGKGSLKKPSFELAKAWIDYRKGWKKTIAAEYLTDRTTTWQSLWKDGQLVIGQGRDRLYWEMSNRVQSGVTGITGTGRLSNDNLVATLSIDCIKAIDNEPNGIFSVDFTYDKDGIPNPTEINIGKFFTTHYFLSRVGCNMPKILLELAFDLYKGKLNRINPINEKLLWIRGMDIQPVLIHEKEVSEKFQEYLIEMKNL